MNAGTANTHSSTGDRPSPGFTAANAQSVDADSSAKRTQHDADDDHLNKRPRISTASSSANIHANGASSHSQSHYPHSSSQPNGAPPRYPDDSAWSAQTRDGSSISDAQVGEVLKSHMSEPTNAPVAASPDQSYQQHSMVDGYPQSQPPAGSTPQQLQRGSGQRKRNFSNRTKTGCMTCRERKKKCDERKPSCANCERGGFVCKGYLPNGAYKSTVPTQPALQPMHNAYPPHYAYPQTYYEQPAQTAAPQPHAQDAHPRAQPYPAPQWAAQQAPQYAQDPMHRPDYLPIAAHPASVAAPVTMPSSEASRQHQQKMPPPEPVHPPHNRSNSSHSSYPPQQYGNHIVPNGQGYAYNAQRMTAQLALEHSSTREPATDKGKMLAGFPYNPRDPELKQERYDCAQRVYRFNKNASEPGLLSDSSKRDQLRQILEPQSGNSPSSRKSPSSRATKPVGHLGGSVEIEAPFYCDYGYNITIKDDVDIGPNCRIMDAASVEIGERTIIGPDVTILTTDGQHQLHRQAGQKRLMRAQRVKIGKDVFIGAGAIILPGRTIADGATIGAGTVVHHDVNGPHTFINNLGERKPNNAWAYGQQQQPQAAPQPQTQPQQHAR